MVVESCIRIIAQHGLQGLPYTRLMEILAFSPGWGSNVPCPIFQDKLWTHLLARDTVWFYVPHYEPLQSDTAVLEKQSKMANVADGKKLRGYCCGFEKMERVKVTGMTHTAAVKRYPDLHITTVQDVRNELYARDTSHYLLSDLSTKQYSVYELYRRMGKRGVSTKDLSYAFQCKPSSIAFYTDLIEKFGPLKIGFTVQVPKRHNFKGHFFFHRDYSRSVHALPDILNGVIKELGKEDTPMSAEMLRKKFNDAVPSLKLVDSLDETYELVEYFLLKLSAIELTEKGEYIAQKGISITTVQRDITEENRHDAEYSFYGDVLVAGETLESQILRFIEGKGPKGASGADISQHFGMNDLVVRSFIRAFHDMGYISSKSTVSQKTNQFLYSMKKFSKCSDREEEPKCDVPKSNHLPTNIERLHRLMALVNKHRILTRYEMRTFMKAEDGDAIIHAKTMKKLLNTLCSEKKLIRLVTKGSDTEEGEILEMYHLPGCTKSEIAGKVKMMKDLVKADILDDMLHVGPIQAYLSSFREFPNAIPEDFVCEGDFISVGGYNGPKAILIQQVHFIFSVLIYRWSVCNVPSFLMDLRSWWEYVLTLPPIAVQADGSYEVVDLVNYLPLTILNYVLKGFTFGNLQSVMNHNVYSKYCIGQLPSHMIIKFSKDINFFVNCMARIVQYFDYLDLVEMKNKFDFLKRNVIGFRFALRKNGMLLNTKSALVNKRKFRGYNIKRIHNPQKILVFDLANYVGYSQFWNSAKEICLANPQVEFWNYMCNATEEPKSLRQVLRENDIPSEEEESFYESPGIAERLSRLYSELGPGGFNIRLCFEKKRNWGSQLVSSNLKTRMTFRIDIAINNIKSRKGFGDQLQDKSDDDSNSDDYTSYTRSRRFKKMHQPKVESKIPVPAIPKPPPTRKRKRLTSLTKVSSGVKAAKRVKKKYRDDFDKKAISAKIIERVHFSSEEDNIIVIWAVCLRVFGHQYHIYEARDLLHKCCPKKAVDKTAESIKKRMQLLLDRPEVQSKFTDLQLKATAYRKMMLDGECDSKVLFSHRNEWAGEDFEVRSILPSSLAEFRSNSEVLVATEDDHHLLVFLSQGHRHKRVERFKDRKIQSIWDLSTFGMNDRHIYSHVILSVSSNDSNHNEIAYKVLKSFNEDDISKISDYMKNSRCIRKKKRRLDENGRVLQHTKLSISGEVDQSLYYPYPDEIITQVEASAPKSLVEFHYSELGGRHVHSLSQYFYKGLCKVIISGAIDPFIEHKKFHVAFKDVPSEESLYAYLHTKKNTFVSGFSSVEQAKSSGFQLSEKHISGRASVKVHPVSEEDKIEGMEELLGIKENSWPLPLKIFYDPVDKERLFSWKFVDFKTGTVGDKVSVDCDFPSAATELSIMELCLANGNICVNENDLLKRFAEYCKVFEREELMAPGQMLLELVFRSKGNGVELSHLKSDVMKNSYSHSKLTEGKFDELLDVCVNLEILIRVGFTDEIIIARHFAADWTILPDKEILAENLQSCNGNPKLRVTKEQVLETNFSNFFPVSRKPWKKMNAEVNDVLLEKLVKSMVMMVYCYPGMSKELIDSRFHVHLSPLDVKDILECLIFAEILRRDFDVPEPATLFSSTLPQLGITRGITSRSTFVVTEEGLSNLAGFMK